MAGLRPGHPRLSCPCAARTWMPAPAGHDVRQAAQRSPGRNLNAPLTIPPQESPSKAVYRARPRRPPFERRAMDSDTLFAKSLPPLTRSGTGSPARSTGIRYAATSSSTSSACPGPARALDHLPALGDPGCDLGRRPTSSPTSRKPMSCWWRPDFSQSNPLTNHVISAWW